MIDTPKPSFLRTVSRFFSAPFRIAALEAQNTHFTRFLSAFPGEYCAIPAPVAPHQHQLDIITSPGFCHLFGLKTITALTDIQAILSPSDSAALEGFVDRLHTDSAPFTLTVHTQDERTIFKLSGSKPTDRSTEPVPLILWAEDITQSARKTADREARALAKETRFQHMRHALNALPRPVWLRDSQQKLTWVNSTYSTYLDKPPATIISEQIPITAGAAKRKGHDVSTLLTTLAQTAHSTGTAQEQKIHAIFHGKRLLLRISEIPIPDLDMTLGFAYDITHEEELETTFKRFELSTNELMGHLRSAICIFDAAEQLIFYNAPYQQLWGLNDSFLNQQPKLGDVMEKLREQRCLPEQADFRAYKKTWRTMFTNLIRPNEDMLYLPDGRAIRMLVIPHSTGGLMMTFEDVTSRLALESSYNTLVAVQKETLDNLAEAVSVFGGDGRLKLWNPSYARLWDFSPETLADHPHIHTLVQKKERFFSPDRWTEQKRIITSRALRTDLSENRLTCQTDDDNERLLDVHAVSLPDGGVLITYTDVTSTVKIENALREKAQALETAEHLKLDFLANVSYQLRTPLSSIMGFTDILKNEYFGPLNTRQKSYTTDIQTASDKLLHLINNILDLSTLEAGFLSLDRNDFNIRRLMDSTHELVEEWARKDALTLKLTCAKTIGTLNGDEHRIQQALVNLIRNAIAFTPEGGTITLHAKRTASCVEFIVKDTGAGIAKEDKSRIFEPFERASATHVEDRVKRTASGAGIGLSLVRRIAEAHDGQVTLDSAPGKGTKVTLTIPLTRIKTDLTLPHSGS